jgi:3-hydroxybutyryl-CoA dehydratase
MTNIRKKAIEGLIVGDTFSVSRTFSEEDMLRFADISRDYNPVHFDERFARVKGFRDRVCHGLLVGSLITEIGGQIGWLASAMDFRFKKPVYFGDTVRCDFTITEIHENGRVDAAFVFGNQDGVTVLEGSIRGILPGPEEKRVMRQMSDQGSARNRRASIREPSLP